MKEELKQAVEVVTNHPKVAAAFATTSFFDWINEGLSLLFDNIDPILSISTKFTSLLLLVILVRYHFVNTQKIKQDIEKEKNTQT